MEDWLRIWTLKEPLGHWEKVRDASKINSADFFIVRSLFILNLKKKFSKENEKLLKSLLVKEYKF